MFGRVVKIAEAAQVMCQCGIAMTGAGLGSGDSLVVMDIIIFGGGADETEDFGQGLFRAPTAQRL